MIAIACKKPPKNDGDSDSDAKFSSGDIIIANTGTRSVLVFDEDGKYKSTLFEISSTSGFTPNSLLYLPETEEILIALDGTSDELIAIDKEGERRSFFLNTTLLNGTIRAMALLTGGDILVGETNAIERFRSDGLNLSAANDGLSGVWPKANVQTAISGMSRMPNNGFVACSTTSDVVRTYDNTFAQVGSAASGIAGTTDVVACQGQSDGSVIAAFLGTTDTIRKYSAADLSATAWSFSNIPSLAAPSALAIRANGNILVTDSVFNYVVELSSSGSLLGVLQGADVDIDNMLATPNSIIVVP